MIGAAGITSGLDPVHLNWMIPLVGVYLNVDHLGGFFMLLTGATAIPIGIYTIGYARSQHFSRTALAALPVFVAAMLLVPAAGSITTFLLGWELMAITSLVLVATEHHREEVRAASTYYAVMTQMGFAAILVGLAMHSHGHDIISELGTPSTTVFLLLLAGFGSKADLVPLHAWLPKAHSEAPSPVSALMSATMVTLGIYGIIRFCLLGPTPSWWGLLILAVGAMSALFGVLQASVATDLKRLLAYSTLENMGLITMTLGVAILLNAHGQHNAATVAFTAAGLHLYAHAAFKSLAFMAAGSVLASTGFRDLDRLGGLARRMPMTTILFGVAALGATGLPLGVGFVSEWLLIQALIHASPDQVVIALVIPLAIGVVALATGLSVAAMVKAFGIGFLARPRSSGARTARDAPPAMAAGMTIAAVACTLLAVAPQIMGPILAAFPASGPPVDLGIQLHLPGLGGSLGPGVIATVLIVASVAAALLYGRAKAESQPLWACGVEEMTPRMQYTATSFAEPLQRVFDDVLRPDTDVEVTPAVESRYLVERVAYKARITDAIEDRLYRPIWDSVFTAARFVARMHTGSVHLYLAYGSIGVFLAILAAR
ncbi:MAG: hypothetical protein LLG14_08585 [Nocardiaceae bacterium]|nr:hypothetical protein [Nocardiaceae bacterium]